MDIVYELVDNKPLILGRRYKMEVGDVLVDKIIYRPTLDRFEKFYNIIKTKSWFNNYKFTVVGSFPNIMNNNKLWETWDVDMDISSNSEQLDYNEIKTMLNECSRISLEECDFYLELYFNLSNKFPQLHVNESFNVHNYKDFCYKHTINILSHLLHVKRDNKIVTKWPIGKEIIEGLWERTLKFPTEKQVIRKINNLSYDAPVDMKKYFSCL